MVRWGVDSEFFQRGVKLDPTGCGAGWARIAVAARASDPREAQECAKQAMRANLEAWRPWYEAFVREEEAPAEEVIMQRTAAGWRGEVMRGL